MKKIKSIKQLRTEKDRINNRLEELENAMHTQWKELKQELKPTNLIKDSISSLLKKKIETNIEEDSFLKSTFAYGVNLLVGKLADKAREKFGTIFKK
jgi:predicted nuclease with TOPRIM domain